MAYVFIGPKRPSHIDAVQIQIIVSLMIRPGSGGNELRPCKIILEDKVEAVHLNPISYLHWLLSRYVISDNIRGSNNTITDRRHRKILPRG